MYMQGTTMTLLTAVKYYWFEVINVAVNVNQNDRERVNRTYYLAKVFSGMSLMVTVGNTVNRRNIMNFRAISARARQYWPFPEISLSSIDYFSALMSFSFVANKMII